MKSLATVEYPENSPHALMEGPTSYSIVLNMLGIEQEDIGIKVDEQRSELAVLARKESYSCQRGFFWIFGVPSGAKVREITTRFRGGVLEIIIPKSVAKCPVGAVA